MRWESLSSRLLLWILPTFLLATVAISASAYLISRTLLMREMEQQVRVLTEVAASEVRAFHEQRVNDLATIGQSPLFKDYHKNVDFGLAQEAAVYRSEIDRMLLDFSRRAGVYPRLLHIDAAGREVNRVEEGLIRPEARRSAAGNRRYLEGLRPGRHSSSGLLRGGPRGAPAVESRLGIYDDAGTLRGALVFECSLARILGGLARLRIGRSGRSYLLRDGEPVARGAGAGAGPFVTASLPVGDTRWGVRTVVGRAEFLDRLHWLGRLTILLAFSTISLIVLVVSRLVRGLLRPIGTLADAAGAYAAGRLDVRVDGSGPGEVAALSKAFNSMADSLKQRTDDLEHRVRELTALRHVNEAALRQLGRGEIARVCVETVVTGLGFERAALYWVDEERGELRGECGYRTAVAREFAEPELRRRRLELASGNALARAARGREPLRAGAEGKPASCVVPILGRDRVLAVIEVDDASVGGVSPPRMRSLSIFGGTIGLALENAELLGALVDSEARYRTAVENSPDAIIGLDQNLRVTLWNRRAEALFGFQPTEAYGGTLEPMFEPGAYARLVRQLETSGALRQAEAPGRTRDGRRLELSVSWTGQAAAYGASREWFVVIQDQTDQKRLQAQLTQAEKMSAVGNLVAGVVHELNNPLGGVMGYAELLADLPASPGVRDDIRLLHDSALRCREIVRGLLLFVRKGHGERHRVALNGVVQAALALCEYRIAKSEGIALEVDLDPAGPEVAAEFQRVQQVLVNLLGNACDALRERSARRVIRLRTRSGPSSCELVVEDNGPGVGKRHLAALFEPFFTTKPEGKGTGLGLSLSRDIMAAFDGSLSHEAPEAGGARFILSFPPCPAGVREPETALGLPPSARGMRALVVDDEPDLAQLMRRLLADDGLTVELAVRASEAVERARSGAFDLIVADVEMGSFKGTELLDTVRGIPSPPAFVFVTGDILNQGLATELARLKAIVVPKPFLRTEFLRAVRHALHQRALQK